MWAVSRPVYIAVQCLSPRRLNYMTPYIWGQYLGNITASSERIKGLTLKVLGFVYKNTTEIDQIVSGGYQLTLVLLRAYI